MGFACINGNVNTCSCDMCVDYRTRHNLKQLTPGQAILKDLREMPRFFFIENLDCVLLAFIIWIIIVMAVSGLQPGEIFPTILAELK